MNTCTWVVTADNSRARIFEIALALAPWAELAADTHPEARWSAQDLVTDGPGMANNSGGRGRHPLQSAVDPRIEETRTFARRVAHRLELAANRDLFLQLIIVAPPPFLGVLRNMLGPNTRRRLRRTLAKDLTLAPMSALRRALGYPPRPIAEPALASH